MKEALGSARNLMLVPQDDGTMMPMIEAILIYTEPKFKLTKEGLEKVRLSGTLRFNACPEVLRALAVQFASWADEADKLATTYKHDVQGMATEAGDGGGVQQPRQ